MNKLYYGAAYYPELWDQETVKRDIEWMKEAQVNVVRMAEFAWSTLEPHPNQLNVEFFTEVIAQLNRNGIQTVLCTPTATPPIWISHEHPERMIVNNLREVMVHGGRQQVCTNNAIMRERSGLIIEEMAKVYGHMPGVIAWQLDNELKGNVSECYCDTCKSLWHKWLEKRYENIETLNSEWGTHIWSQYYESFDQVPQPFKTPMGHNPSLVTAYHRFSRDLAADFLQEQAEIIRKHSNLPITHNSSLNHFIDNEKCFAPLDFAAFDHYSTSAEYQQMLFWLDTFKTLKGDVPFWVMETAPTFSGSIYGHHTIHKNGYIMAEAAAAYALGAEGFNYWLWRQHRTGVEFTHGHVISSWGKPGVGYKNVVETGILKNKLEKAFANTKPAKAEIAVTYSDMARSFFMVEPFESGGIDYTFEMKKWYERIMKMGYHRDFIFESHTFNGYKILMTPFMSHLSKAYMERAKAFVEDGGIWIVGPLTGIRTGEHTLHTDHALGALEAFAGVKTVFHYPMTGSGAVGEAFDIQAPLSLWSSAFECVEATELGTIKGGVSPGLSFLTEYQRGTGKIVMLGSMPEGGQGNLLLEAIIGHYLNEAGILKYECTPGTIVIPRHGDSIDQQVLINMDGEGGEVYLPCDYEDVCYPESKASSVINLKPYECRVMQRSM